MQMPMSINDLRDICSLMVEVIDDRNFLLRENVHLREELEKQKKFIDDLYKKDILATAEILSIMIDKATEK